MLSISQTEKENIIAMLQKAIDVLSLVPADNGERSCGGCQHMSNTGDWMCQKWNQSVPDHARAAGCDAWVDLIPF